MESEILFRDYQEQQAQDHNDLQGYVRQSIDHVVYDGITSIRRYAGFNTVKTGQAEVQIAPGRFYDLLGAVYSVLTTTTQSMLQYLAGEEQRWMLLTVVGTEVETDIEERDYLIDVTSGATEPRAVATVKSRSAVLTWTQGVESADPQVPAVPVGHVAVTKILLDPTQVVSVTMYTENEVASTNDLDLRANALEAFQAQVGPKLSSLASDIAALQNLITQLGTGRDLQAVSEDLARVKDSLRYPAGVSDYGADHFLSQAQSDMEDTLGHGHTARVEEGIRFPWANEDWKTYLTLNPNEPNASYHAATGLLLPKYSSVLKLSTSDGTPTSSQIITQYGYQTVTMKTGRMSRSRLRYGGSRYTCSNANYYDLNDPWAGILDGYKTLNPASTLYTDPQTGYPDGTVSVQFTMEGQTWYDPRVQYNHEVIRYDSWWLDTWTEPYIYAVTTDNVVSGHMMGQTFLAANDMWLTQLSFYVSTKSATNEDISVAIAHTAHGMPDITRAIVKLAHSYGNITTGWNLITLAAPIFLSKGTKYALILVSGANHAIGMTAGTYSDGTYFYSTDGVYFQGDLTKEIAFRLYAAKFDAPHVVIPVDTVNLDGGIRAVDIQAEQWVPASTQLTWECRPGGQPNAWRPLTHETALTSFGASPPSSWDLRLRFDGTVDMQAGINLTTGFMARMTRPGLALKHVSMPITFAAAQDELHVKVVLEAFYTSPDPNRHTHSCTVYTGAGTPVTWSTAALAPSTTVTKILDAPDKRYERHYTWLAATLGTVQNVLIVQNGATTSDDWCFHVAERTYYAT